jgi:hypothetical protein
MKTATIKSASSMRDNYFKIVDMLPPPPKPEVGTSNNVLLIKSATEKNEKGDIVANIMFNPDVGSKAGLNYILCFYGSPAKSNIPMGTFLTFSDNGTPFITYTQSSGYYSEPQK